MALMHSNATARGIIGPYVPIGNFLFVYTRQTICIVIMRIRIEFAQEGCNVFMELRVSGFPTERHNDMLINKCRIRYNTGLFICALIERHRQCPDFLLDRLFKLTSAIVRLYPSLLDIIHVDKAGNGYCGHIGWFIRVFYVRNQRKQQWFVSLGMFVPNLGIGPVYIV